MYEHPQFTINRSLIVLLPKQAAFEWVMQTGSKPPNMTLADMRHDPKGFLVSLSKVETSADAEPWVHKRWDLFFTHFLNALGMDEQSWPQKRSLEMFKDWFEVQFHSMVWDLSDDPIARENV